MTDYYMRDDKWKRLTEALAAIEPCPFAGRVTADQVAIVLGEVGGIWPASVVAANFAVVSRGRQHAS